MSDQRTALSMLAEQQKLAAQTEEQKKRDQVEWLMSKVTDWENPPIPIRAAILQSRAWRTKDGFVYMTYGEAMGAVIYCAKRGVDENSEEYWWDPAAKKNNLTSEGEIAYAHHKGYSWTVPKYEHKTRPWADPKKAIPGFPQELGCVCSFTLKTGFGSEEVSAEVWMSEWYVPANPNWQTRTRWMLEVRSLSNGIKRGTGAAIAANLSESTLQVAEEEAPELPAVQAKRVEFKHPPVGTMAPPLPEIVNNDTDLLPLLEKSIPKK